MSGGAFVGVGVGSGSVRAAIFDSSGERLAEIVEASRDVAATRSRKQKTARLARLLGALDTGEVRAGVGFLCGELLQGKLGVGYRTLQQLQQLSAEVETTVTVTELDTTFL